MGVSMQLFSFIVMLAFCLGFALIMFLGGFLGIVRRRREHVAGRNRSAMLNSMDDEQYKTFLVKASAYAGLPVTTHGGWLSRLGIMKEEAVPDFVRLISNEHSFYSMLLADDLHPYSRIERTASFFIVNCIMIMLLFFVASGYIFHPKNYSNQTPEPTANELLVYQFCVLAPIKVMVAYMLFFILGAPWDRNFSEYSRAQVNFWGHALAVIMIGGAFYCLWRASLVVKVANSELRENLPSYIYSVLLSGNVLELMLFALKFVDLTESSKLPRWLISFLVMIDKLCFGQLDIGAWDAGKTVRLESPRVIPVSQLDDWVDQTTANL